LALWAAGCQTLIYINRDLIVTCLRLFAQQDARVRVKEISCSNVEMVRVRSQRRLSATPDLIIHLDLHQPFQPPFSLLESSLCAL
jgi:hypothetical protein